MKIKNQIIKLFKEGKTYSEIAKELKCSKGTISFHCSKLENNRRINKSNSDLINKINDLYLIGKTYDQISKELNVGKSTIIKYKDKRKSIDWKKLSEEEKTILLRNNSTKYYKTRRNKIKNHAIQYKGGKCKKCGYNKCFGAMEFHHLDPSQKDFLISRNYKKSWEKIKIELDKTILLCANCHREYHSIKNLEIDIFLTKF